MIYAKVTISRDYYVPVPIDYSEDMAASKALKELQKDIKQGNINACKDDFNVYVHPTAVVVIKGEEAL